MPRDTFHVVESVYDDVRCLAKFWPEQRLDAQSAFFQATVLSATFAESTFEIIHGSPFSSIRDEEMIRRYPKDDLAFDVVLSGQLWREHRGVGDLQLEQDVSLSHSDEPSSFRWLSQGSMVRVRRRTDTLPLRLKSVATQPYGVLPATPLANSYAAFITALAKTLMNRTPVQRELGEALSGLTSLVLEESIRDDRVGQVLPLQLRVQQYIDTHYSERRLSPPYIAAELGVSLRAVHKAFNSNNRTIGSYVRERRAKAAVDELRAGPISSLNDLAVRCGFGGRDQLRRAISEVYGLPASDALREARLAAHRLRHPTDGNPG